jgi:phosphatidylserine/phosphatidylglycerophosphate/cardiolipin synthase-like enzyme
VISPTSRFTSKDTGDKFCEPIQVAVAVTINLACTTGVAKWRTCTPAQTNAVASWRSDGESPAGTNTRAWPPCCANLVSRRGTGPSSSVMTATGPGALSGAAIQPAMVALLAHATGPVDVAANYLTDYAIQDALAAAAARGIPVHVVINPTAFGAAAAARWLTDHGVTVRDAPAAPYLHAKVLLTGDTGLIGSANFSYDALHARNHEFDVTLPAAVMPAAAAWFAALWARSTPVSQ